VAAFQPAREYLERYADVLVNFGLHEGEGLRRDEVVTVCAPENAKPLFEEVCRAVWRAGGHVIPEYMPADHDFQRFGPDFYEIASDAQLAFCPDRLFRGVLEQVDHLVYLTSFSDPRALSSVPPERIMRREEALRPLVDMQQAREAEGKFSWTIGLYGTEAMAAEAGMSIGEYWEQIVAACYLDDPDPVARWHEVDRQVGEHCDFLNSLDIDRLHVAGEDADLWLSLGEKRKWIGGGGANIPSFEVFTSPDWRGTEGRIRFSEPLYVYGSLIKRAELEFRDGRVIRADAEENGELLRQMVSAEGADRVGEFSLTDARLSRITRFMAHTLFDENMGGPYGNTHLAIGLAYQTCYDGDKSAVTDEEWDRLGFNRSSVHTDIVSTTDRTVTAVLRDGSQRVIYADGRFQHD
jgi:aminopeptidase